VVGVVSTNPGFLLGGGKGAPVAFSGRVPVLVTSEAGQVNSGDKLTLSLTQAGYAMKLTTTEGLMIGTAMSPDNGSGKVLMLVEKGYFKQDVRKKILQARGLAIASATASGTAATTSLDSVFNLKERILAIIDRVENFANQIVTNVLHTQLLCVGKYCVNEDQFGRIITGSGINTEDTILQSASTSTTSTASPTWVDPGASSTASTSTSATTTTTTTTTTSTTTDTTTASSTAN
jgi:hypothetical protein